MHLFLRPSPGMMAFAAKGALPIRHSRRPEIGGNFLRESHSIGPGRVYRDRPHVSQFHLAGGAGNRSRLSVMLEIVEQNEGIRRLGQRVSAQFYKSRDND